MQPNIDFVKVVRELNRKLVVDHKLYKMFEYRTDGAFNYIHFNGIHLWSDELSKVGNEDALIEVLRKRYYDLRTEIFNFDM